MQVIRLMADIWVCASDGHRRRFTGPAGQADAEEYVSALIGDGWPVVISAVYYDGGHPCATLTSAFVPSAAVPLLSPQLRSATYTRDDTLVYLSPEDV